jgi:hypothetical protein
MLKGLCAPAMLIAGAIMAPILGSWSLLRENREEKLCSFPLLDVSGEVEDINVGFAAIS